MEFNLYDWASLPHPNLGENWVRNAGVGRWFDLVLPVRAEP
jgi:hypothetical protein